MKIDRRINVSFSHDEIELISNLADNLRIPITQLIRETIVNRAKEQPRLDINEKHNFNDHEDEVINAVCIAFNVTKSEIIKKVRKRYIVDARTCAAHILRNQLGYGVVKIAKILRKHYTSVVHM